LAVIFLTTAGDDPMNDPQDPSQHRATVRRHPVTVWGRVHTPGALHMDATPGFGTASLRPLLATGGVCAVIAALYALPPLPSNPLVNFGTALAPMVAAASWIRSDARARKIALVHDLGLFVLIAWPVVIPWYAVKTRGRHAWPMALVLLLIIASPMLVSAVISLVRLLADQRR